MNRQSDEKIIERSGSKLRRQGIPKQFTPQDLRRAQRDCEILATKLRDNPEDMTALLDAVLQDRGQDAVRMIKELGLGEEEITAQGGGLFWLVVIAVLLYATDAY
jgi:hypothetical protein